MKIVKIRDYYDDSMVKCVVDSSLNINLNAYYGILKEITLKEISMEEYCDRRLFTTKDILKFAYDSKNHNLIRKIEITIKILTITCIIADIISEFYNNNALFEHKDKSAVLILGDVGLMSFVNRTFKINNTVNSSIVADIVYSVHKKTLINDFQSPLEEGILVLGHKYIKLIVNNETIFTILNISNNIIKCFTNIWGSKDDFAFKYKDISFLIDAENELNVNCFSKCLDFFIESAYVYNINNCKEICESLKTILSNIEKEDIYYTELFNNLGFAHAFYEKSYEFFLEEIKYLDGKEYYDQSNDIIATYERGVARENLLKNAVNNYLNAT